MSEIIHYCQECGGSLYILNKSIDLHQDNSFFTIDLYKCNLCGRLCYI